MKSAPKSQTPPQKPKTPPGTKKLLLAWNQNQKFYKRYIVNPCNEEQTHDCSELSGVEEGLGGDLPRGLGHVVEQEQEEEEGEHWHFHNFLIWKYLPVMRCCFRKEETGDRVIRVERNLPVRCCRFFHLTPGGRSSLSCLKHKYIQHKNKNTKRWKMIKVTYHNMQAISELHI